jgi:hypothetical protein
VNIAAGITLFQQTGMTGVTEGLHRMPWPKRLVVLAIFGLPTAAFWAPLLASGYSAIGGDAARLRVWIVAVVATLILTVAVLHRRLQHRQSLLPFIIFPIVAAATWLVLDRLGLRGFPFWPASEHDWATWAMYGSWWALAATWALTPILRRARTPWRLQMIPIVATVYAVLSLIRIVPSYMAPHYTMRQTSESLARELAGVRGVIFAQDAEGLFNANALRYWNAAQEGMTPDVFVVAHFDTPDGKLADEYRLVARYDLFISPLYRGLPGNSPRLPVHVYRRREL